MIHVAKFIKVYDINREADIYINVNHIQLITPDGGICRVELRDWTHEIRETGESLVERIHSL